MEQIKYRCSFWARFRCPCRATSSCRPQEGNTFGWHDRRTRRMARQSRRDYVCRMGRSNPQEKRRQQYFRECSVQSADRYLLALSFSLADNGRGTMKIGWQRKKHLKWLEGDLDWVVTCYERGKMMSLANNFRRLLLLCLLLGPWICRSLSRRSSVYQTNHRLNSNCSGSPSTTRTKVTIKCISERSATTTTYKGHFGGSRPVVHTQK